MRSRSLSDAAVANERASQAMRAASGASERINQSKPVMPLDVTALAAISAHTVQIDEQIATATRIVRPAISRRAVSPNPFSPFDRARAPSLPTLAVLIISVSDRIWI